jgi:hypothetical protein
MFCEAENHRDAEFGRTFGVERVIAAVVRIQLLPELADVESAQAQILDGVFELTHGVHTAHGSAP